MTSTKMAGRPIRSRAPTIMITTTMMAVSISSAPGVVPPLGSMSSVSGVVPPLGTVGSDVVARVTLSVGVVASLGVTVVMVGEAVSRGVVGTTETGVGMVCVSERAGVDEHFDTSLGAASVAGEK